MVHQWAVCSRCMPNTCAVLENVKRRMQVRLCVFCMRIRMHVPIKFALLAALLVAQVSGQNTVEPTTDCPRPVNCVRDPCEGARCPRFLNTECRADFCSGECKATFFRLSNGKEVTDRCSAETCGEKVCPGNRTCIEEVVPPSCPAGSPNCRQYIKPRCILPPPVMNCSFVACHPETVCVVKDTPRGPRPRCVAPPPPSSCDELKCEEGMECLERKGEGLRSVVRCVPASIVSDKPRNCSELECPDGFVCMVTNNRAICAMAPTPRTCSELECEPGQECRQVNVTSNTSSSSAPLCISVLVIGSTCEELKCEELVGQECTTLTVDNLNIPIIFSTNFCAPTANCSLLEAHCQQRGQVCEVKREGDSAVARCVQPTTCEKVLCNPGFECVAFMLNSTKCPAAVGPGFPMPMLSQPSLDQNFAVCFPSDVLRSSCKELNCRDDQGCTFFGYPARNVSLAYCSDQPTVVPSPQPTITPFPQPTCNDTNLCFGGMEICVDLKQDDIQLDTSCVTINCLENDTICDPGFTCRSLPGEFKSTADFDSVCTEDASNFEFGGGCKERKCDEGQMCYEVEFEGELVGTICIPRQQPTPPTPSPQPTCNDTNPCFGGMEICVDLKQDDIQLDTSCVTINCLENDTICDPGFTCRSLPGEFKSTADFDSVCTEDASNFEFGGGCKERKCDEGQMCYEVEFEGELVGTICIPRQQPTPPTPSPQPTCNDTNPCFGGMEICVDLKEDNIQLGTSCVTTNCLGNNTTCDPGFTCHSIPGEFKLIADFDSVCTEDASNFDFGGGCEERECDEGQMCQNVEFERTLVGTVCIPRQRPPELGCTGLNCREGEECAIFWFGNGPPIAGCVCSALVTQSLEPIDIPPSTLCDDIECDEDAECQVIVKEAGFPLVAPVCVPTGLNAPNAGKRV